MAIRALEPAQFASYRDYILSLHLSPAVRWSHAVGTLIGTVLYALAAIQLSAGLFLLAIFFYYGVGYLSHIAFDGCAPQPAREAWRSFDVHWFVLVMNYQTMTGRFPAVEADLRARYPFLDALDGLPAQR